MDEKGTTRVATIAAHHDAEWVEKNERMLEEEGGDTGRVTDSSLWPRTRILLAAVYQNGKG